MSLLLKFLWNKNTEHFVTVLDSKTEHTYRIFAKSKCKNHSTFLFCMGKQLDNVLTVLRHTKYSNIINVNVTYFTQKHYSYLNIIMSSIKEMSFHHLVHLCITTVTLCESNWSPTVIIDTLSVWFLSEKIIDLNHILFCFFLQEKRRYDCCHLMATWGLLHKTFYRRKLRLFFTGVFSCVKVNGRIMLTWVFSFYWSFSPVISFMQ